MQTLLFLIGSVLLFSAGFVAGTCWHDCQRPAPDPDDEAIDPAAWWESGDIRLSPYDPQAGAGRHHGHS